MNNEDMLAGTAALAGRCARYLRETLGVIVDPIPWAGGAQLPFFMKARYGLFEFELLGASLLLLTDCGDEQTPETVEKHVAQVRKFWDGEVVYLREAVTGYNRKRLIERRVSFVVPAKHMYLPTLGVDLREHFKQLRAKPKVLSPSAQVLLIYLLLHREDMGISSDATPGRMKERLGYSAITMTRAFDELEAAAIGAFDLKGRERRLVLSGESREIWQRAQPFLRTPVVKRVWCRNVSLEGLAVRAGFSALAQYTAMAAAAHETVAVARRKWKALVAGDGVREIPYGEPEAAEVEVWRYAPEACAQGPVVDRLSLWLSLRDDPNERVEGAREELLEGLGWFQG